MRRKLNILGVSFSVHRSLKKMPDKADYGETDMLERRIYLNPVKNKTDDELMSTLLHEVIHAILGVSGQDAHINSEHEEGLVTVLENGLYPLIKKGVFSNNKKGNKDGKDESGVLEEIREPGTNGK